MEIVKNKYVILNADFSKDYNVKNENIKLKLIADFILKTINGQKCTLFEIKPTAHSIIYEVASEHQNLKLNGKKFLVAQDVNLKKEDIFNLVGAEEFYLGHLIILLSKITENKLTEIANLWHDEISITGLEFFRMGNDGLSFYWYNPLIKSFEDIFRVFLDEIKKQVETVK